MIDEGFGMDWNAVHSKYVAAAYLTGLIIVLWCVLSTWWGRRCSKKAGK